MVAVSSLLALALFSSFLSLALNFFSFFAYLCFTAYNSSLSSSRNSETAVFSDISSPYICLYRIYSPVLFLYLTHMSSGVSPLEFLQRGLISLWFSQRYSRALELLFSAAMCSRLFYRESIHLVLAPLEMRYFIQLMCSKLFSVARVSISGVYPA
jgi:hypothetical protein